jgi:hypothetical protein
MAQISINVQSPLTWLTITTSTDPSFSAQAAAILGASAATQLSPVLPYSAIVANHGSTAIAGIVMRWEIDYPGHPANPVVRQFFYHGDPVVIPAGEARVFTPIKETMAIATQAVLQAGTGAGQSGYSPNANSQRALNSLASSTAMLISVDLAIDSQGNTAGPDVGRTIKRLAFQKDDYADIRNQMLLRLNGGDSDQALTDWP